jgi:hypothetical protein
MTINGTQQQYETALAIMDGRYTAIVHSLSHGPLSIKETALSACVKPTTPSERRATTYTALSASKNAVCLPRQLAMTSFSSNAMATREPAQPYSLYAKSRTTSPHLRSKVFSSQCSKSMSNAIQKPSATAQLRIVAMFTGVLRLHAQGLSHTGVQTVLSRSALRAMCSMVTTHAQNTRTLHQGGMRHSQI